MKKMPCIHKRDGDKYVVTSSVLDVQTRAMSFNHIHNVVLIAEMGGARHCAVIDRFDSINKVNIESLVRSSLAKLRLRETLRNL